MHKRTFRLAALVAGMAIGLLGGAPGLVRDAYATLNAPGNTVTFAGNGATTSFTTTFSFLQGADLVVTVAGVTKTLGTDFSVSGAGNATGTVTFTTAPANLAAVVITRTVDYLQKTSLKSQRTYDPTSVEKALDKLAMGEQQLQALYTNPPASILPSQVTAKLNGIRFADQFANIQAALTDAGTTGAVLIPPNYAGVDTFTNPNAIPVIDLRGGPGRWRGAVSVKDHGACGDNICNDTGVIQAAIDALPAGGGVVVVPAGNYKANLRIKKSNVTLLGYGKASIITAATNASPIIDLTSDVTTGQLRGVSVIGLKLVGTGSAGIGIRMQAATPYVVEGSAVRDIWFSGLGNALQMVCTSANETYQNHFENLNSDTTSGDAFVVAGVYNTFVGIKAANNSANAWADAGWNTSLTGLDVDGVVRYTGQGARYAGITIETIFGTGPGAAGAVQLSGFRSDVRGVMLTNIAHAKANYGVEVGNGPHHISSVHVVASANNDTFRPQYPFSLNPGSSGTISDSTAPGLFTVEAALPASTLANWTFSGDLTGVSTAGKGFYKAQRLIKSISADRGDTSQTLTVGTDAQIQRWATALTANRTVTLSTTGAVAGDTFRVVRTGLGAFTLDVGGLKTIPSATAAFVDIAYDGAAWRLAGYGAL